MESRPGAVAPRELRPHDPVRVGPYTLDARIGEGGMGAVYLGRGADGRRVAVKVVRPELAGDGAFVARFTDECRNAERVASFCTAQVLDHGRDLGMAYMVTEYIEGPSLLQHIGEQGTLSPGLLHGVAVGVAAALVAIHSAGLVHRDLKPSNVLLSISGPRVIDFGIARALDMATSHTATGQVVGTAGYIAPEQILTQTITPAVDVFAWGCLVAYAANGRNPFGQGSLQVMVGRAVHADPELGDLTEPLAGLVRAALRKDPASRPTARDLLLSLVGGSAEADVNTTLGQAWPAPSETRGDAPAPSLPAPPAGHAAASPPGQGGPAPEASREETAAAAETVTDPRRFVGTPPPSSPPAARPATRAVKAGSRRRRMPLAGGAVAAAGVLLVAGLLLRDADGPAARPPATPAGPPTEPMLARVDTEPGWPKECKADIGTFTPGRAAPATLIGGETCDMLPERSPDRRRFAFTRKVGDRHEAWIADADGGGARRVTDRLAGGRVTWSPDGGRLAFMGRENGVRQIFAITIGETVPQRLTRDSADKDDPMWSRDGRLVFWSERDGVEQIYTLDPDAPGAPWRKVSRDSARSVDPEWSPDGTKIAYTRGASPNGRIWVMNADGSGARPLTKGTAHEMDPAWSRDGRWIAYAHGPTATPAVRVINVDGTGDRPFGPPSGTVGHPNWS